MIRETDAHMLQLLADVLHSRQPDAIASEEWPDIFKGLCLHTVHALPSAYAHSLGLSKKDISDYLSTIISSRWNFHMLMKIQSRLADILNHAQIPFVVLKGAASAMNYPQPENRCMGDIDLLILPADAERACDAIVKAGGFNLLENHFDRHYYFFTDEKLKIELHTMFGGSDDPKQNEILDNALYAALSSRIPATVCGYDIPILPPIENGLVLLSHIDHHLVNGIGLRQIIDWMLFVEKYLDDDLWNHGFAEMAEQIGMKQLAVLTTGMCQKYLGLQKDIHWSLYEPVCDDFMMYILDCGNFGRKPQDIKDRTVEVLKNFKHPLKGLSMAQAYGLANWEATKKHRILRPFAWCYQFGHWAHVGIKGGADRKELKDAATRAKRENNLFIKLGTTRTRK